MGEVTHEENNHLEKLHWQELAVLVPIVIVIVWIGVGPAAFFGSMDSSVNAIVQSIGPAITSVVMR
jgi:NADH:ubiquinone oxidoreductase subunit 4 (subunit M)